MSIVADQAFGLGIHVDSEDVPQLWPAILRRLGTTSGRCDEVLRFVVRPERARPGYWTVSIGQGPPVGHADDVDEVASFIADRFHERLFDHCRSLDPALLVVHAGVVAVDGSAVLIPGTSMSGKSTIVDALVSRGATYLSDEFAMLDEAGNVWPYPRPIALRPVGTDRRPSPRDRRPSDVAAGPIPVGLVVDTAYEAGARWQPVELTGARTLLPLLAQTASVREHPEQTLRIAAAHARTPLLKGCRGEADAVADALIDVLRNRRRVVS